MVFGRLALAITFSILTAVAAFADPCLPPDDACPLFLACNTLTNECEVVEFDPDNDGLSDGSDPCPYDPRNACVGPVAIDTFTGLPIRLNTNVSVAECAGAKLDCNGDIWAGDFGFNAPETAGTCNLAGGGESCVITGIDTIFGCEDEETEDIFQCEHSDKPASPELSYSFSVPNSRYLVNLYFANTYDLTAAVGTRTFDIKVEGVLAYDNFDQVLAAGGSGVAVVRSVDVSVTDGNGLQIDFVHELENPAVKAIEVLSFSCVESTECDDANPCTDDTCLAGGCDFAPNTAGCSDGLACTSNDACSGGTCVGESNCAPGQACSPQSGVCDAPAISFGKSILAGASIDAPTSLEFGPDGRLYVSQQNGLIHAFTVERTGPDAYVVNDTEVIDLVSKIPNHDDDGVVNPGESGRLLLGIVATGTAENPILYVSSGDPRIGGGPSSNALHLDTNSGMISRLTWNGSAWTKLDLVRGLPRSEENHGANGMFLDEATNTLYVAYGGNTNMGAPSNNFVFLPEYALSAAILAIDLDAIGDTTLDLPTLDDEDAPNLCSAPPAKFGLPCTLDSDCESTPGAGGGVCDLDVNDPFGGNDGKNQAKLIPGSPVQVHASGMRNPYDVIITAAGRMYSIDNGPNEGWGNIPVGEGTSACTNAVSEPGTSQFDQLHYITGPGYYAGHPNPTRASTANTFNASNPQSPVSVDNPVECDYRFPGPEDGALALFSKSTNGLAEYTTDNFGGQMTGNLLAASFSNQIWRIQLNAAGTAATGVAPLFSTVGSKPLDVIAQGPAGPFPGTIWAIDYFFDRVVVFEPGDSGFCTGADDPGLDEDGDNFDNADEIDNGSNPCSSADFPPDADGDFTSDLNDLDDDNDGIQDTVDKFALDPDNGTTTAFPLLYGWENGEAPRGGILDLGFTGLMTNGTSDYLALFDTDKMTAGGAAGVSTVDKASEGDAFGAFNDQEYGFQFGMYVPPDGVTTFTAHTRIVGPFLGQTPADFQSLGLFIGNGDQDNYFKIVASAAAGNGGVETLLETSGTTTAGPVSEVPMPGPEAIDLYLTVDRLSASVQPAYSVTSGGAHGPVTLLGTPALIPSAWLSDPSTGLAIGIISTSRGPAGTFPATWDFIEVSVGPAFCTTDSDCDDKNACSADVCANGSCNNELLVDGSGCDDAVVCTINDTCTAGVCGGEHDCPAGQICVAQSGVCSLVPGDPDNDGLTDAADPCPLDPRNLCFGPVALDRATATPIRLNANVSGAECAGGKIDCTGGIWNADFGYNQGPKAAVCNLNGGSESCVIQGIAAIFGCDDESTEDLFQCEHSDTATDPELEYSFDVPDGSYLVNLYFANTFTGTTTGGSRVFDIEIEGSVAYSDFDQIVAAGGSGIAVVRSIATTVDDGDGMSIRFLHAVENPAIKAIEVLTEEGVTTTTSTTSTTTTTSSTTTTLRACAADSDCNDGNPCTLDDCDGSVCLYAPANAGTPCTEDENPCTNDLCDGSGSCTHPFNNAPCNDGLFCTLNDFCASGSCQGSGIPCGIGETCNETQNSCDAGVCVALSLAGPIRCRVGSECTVALVVDTDGFAVTAAGAALTTDLAAECGAACVPGAAATQTTCFANAPTCSSFSADVAPPATGLGNGELARTAVTCMGSGVGELCISQPAAILADGSAAPVCETSCVPLDCASCIPGDCNQSGGALSAGDTICTANCLIGTPPPGSDCHCAADCNCLGGVEAADPVCAILRQQSRFTPDTCKNGGSALEAEVELRVSEPKLLRDGRRKRVVLNLRGTGAADAAGLRTGLAVDGTLGRIRLSRRLRLAGFRRQLGRVGRDRAVVALIPPPDRVRAIGVGRVLRIALKGATTNIETSGVQFGAITGVPMTPTPEP